MSFIDSTFGAALVGLVVGACLYGITLLQTFSYFRNYSNDNSFVKSLVIVLTYLVTNFGNNDNLDLTTWSMALQTDCNGLIGLIVEAFFARLSKNWILTGIIVILACIHFGLGVGEKSRALHRRILDREYFAGLTRTTEIDTSCISDIIIAVAMCYYLYKKRTGLKRTDSVVTMLMVYSVNSGLVTSIIGTICVVTSLRVVAVVDPSHQFAAMPTNFVWLSFFWVMGKCYVNSFLALLNSREMLRDKVAKGALQLSNFGNPQSNSGSELTPKTPRKPPAVLLSEVPVPRSSNAEQLSLGHRHIPEARASRTQLQRDGPPISGNFRLRSERQWGASPPSRHYEMALRDKLLAALADLPGTRTFHIHVLTSAPRKHNGLFPYARPRPRTYLQDVFVLLSEQKDPDAPHVLVTAIEASVYNIPSTSCGVLYVSKVDSSGHASAPSPTATLVRAFLTYYADPVTRPIAVQHLWIQLFARAQNQYLFPNSSEFEGKRPLSDVKLCAWWKRVYGEVAGEIVGRLKGTGKVKLFYVLPGYSELEAAHTISRALSRAVPSTSAKVQWVYGHPYSQTEIPLPCPKSADPDAPHNLGTIIPWFDDDPKSRFIDEIAYIKSTESGFRSPQRKRPRAPTSSGPGGAKKPAREQEDEEDKDKEKEGRPEGELSLVSADEFWERMSFRQECVAGAVTGFFTLCVSTPPPVNQDRPSQPSPLAPQPGQVAPKLVRRIVASLMNHHEFSTRERAIRATKTLEGVIKGLCDDAPADPAAVPAPSLSPPEHPERPHTPEPNRTTRLEAPQTPPPGRSPVTAGRPASGLPEISPNPFPDPVATRETYTAHIYGSIEVRNAPRGDAGADGGAETSRAGGTAAPAAQPVTVLAVRKKRKPPP
ncbi:histone acetylation protein-domain-containing protein [Dichomitus squalens]|nr:histone acetylation protein-domain-containing protein [Dichomitus squalens]